MDWVKDYDVHYKGEVYKECVNIELLFNVENEYSVNRVEIIVIEKGKMKFLIDDIREIEFHKKEGK